MTLIGARSAYFFGSLLWRPLPERDFPFNFRAIQVLESTTQPGKSDPFSQALQRDFKLDTPWHESIEVKGCWIIDQANAWIPTELETDNQTWEESEAISEGLGESWFIGWSGSRIQSDPPDPLAEESWTIGEQGPAFRLEPLLGTHFEASKELAFDPIIKELERVWQKVAEEAQALPFSGVADYLEQHLGRRLTAFLAHVDDNEAIRRWVAHLEKPEKLFEERLRRAFQATRLLVDAYGDEAARSWFFAKSSYLDGQAPAAVLRDNQDVKQFDLIVLAVESFVERDAV